MYSRLLSIPKGQSFFLFGPRGTGKSFWIKQLFPDELYFDLLKSGIFTELLASPERLETKIPSKMMTSGKFNWIILDEVQKIPALLDEVHRLIETFHYRFILTGSSARKLKRGGANLLAGRAITRRLYPLTSIELGNDFDFLEALKFGLLPGSILAPDRKDFLDTYVATYLREEIIAEGIARNLAAFARFLEAASFSQAQPLNVTTVAEDCGIHRKVAEDYFQILEDLLLAQRIPVFTKRAKRKMSAHPKFFYFDVGVFRAIRPKGLLDSEAEIDGASLETLIWQEITALNDYYKAGYQISFWRTASKLEVDLVLYGPKGFFAIEIKRSSRVRAEDLVGLKAFLEDYPKAHAILIYTGTQAKFDSNIEIIPIENCFGKKSSFLNQIFEL